MREIRFKRSRKKRTPGLNTTSTADISFILLIFFLVTTSLDTDQGLVRQMPPMPKEETQDRLQIERDDVLQIDVNARDSIFVNGQQTDLRNLSTTMKDFIKLLPKKRVISIHADRESSYDAYFQIQNKIVDVYNSLRDDFCMKNFGKPYAKCSQECQEEAVAAFPQRISETIDAADEGKEERKR